MKSSSYRQGLVLRLEHIEIWVKRSVRWRLSHWMGTAESPNRRLTTDRILALELCTGEFRVRGEVSSLQALRLR